MVTTTTPYRILAVLPLRLVSSYIVSFRDYFGCLHNNGDNFKRLTQQRGLAAFSHQLTLHPYFISQYSIYNHLLKKMMGLWLCFFFTCTVIILVFLCDEIASSYITWIELRTIIPIPLVPLWCTLMGPFWGPRKFTFMVPFWGPIGFGRLPMEDFQSLFKNATSIKVSVKTLQVSKSL